MMMISKKTSLLLSVIFILLLFTGCSNNLDFLKPASWQNPPNNSPNNTSSDYNYSLSISNFNRYVDSNIGFFNKIEWGRESSSSKYGFQSLQWPGKVIVAELYLYKSNFTYDHIDLDIDLLENIMRNILKDYNNKISLMIDAFPTQKRIVINNVSYEIYEDNTVYYNGSLVNIDNLSIPYKFEQSKTFSTPLSGFFCESIEKNSKGIFRFFYMGEEIDIKEELDFKEISSGITSGEAPKSDNKNNQTSINNNSDVIYEDYCLKVNSLKITINNEEYLLNAPVIEKNGSAYLPLRFFAERLGAENLVYEPNTKTINFTLSRYLESELESIKENYIFQIGSKKVVIQNKENLLNAPVISINDSAYLPLRFFTERLGAENLVYEPNNETIKFRLKRASNILIIKEVSLQNLNTEVSLKKIITSTKEYEEIYGSNQSIIDFSKYSIALYTYGKANINGIKVTVNSIIIENNKIIIHVKNISPGKNCFVTEGINYPFSAVFFKKTDLPFEWDIQSIIEDCDT